MEGIMALRYIGVDERSEQGNCPTVWVDSETKDFVLQGWKVDATTREECLVSIGTVPGHEGVVSIPDNEAVIRIPARMVDLIREACDAVEGS
jgi:hypothetical protein